MATTGKSATFDNDLMKLIFNATPIANLADNATSSPLTNLYVSLHTATPDVSGNQLTNEISYTGYARIAVARSISGFTVSGASVSPVGAITFPQMAGGAGGIASFWAVGISLTGTGKILYFGTVTPGINVTLGLTPQLTTLSTITES